MTPRIRVQLVDDHGVLRAGLALLINNQGDMEVVAEAADAAGAVERARQSQPDVILLDITLPDMSGIQAITPLLDKAPAARILVLSVHEDHALVRSALAAGAAGYLVKRATGSDLIQGIRTVAAGRSYVNVPLAGHGLSTVAAAGPPARTAERLSDRECQVLRLLALGYTNKEIAHQLRLSVKSVETYRQRLSDKLGLRGRAELVRFALKSQILKEPL